MIWFCIPCIVLIAYFGIAGIFFPKYRVYIKEGWKCFLDKLRGKKCSIAFDERMRIKFAAWISTKSKRLGKFFYNKRNFNITLSVAGITFTIISIYFIYLFIEWIILGQAPCVNDVCGV